MNFLTYDDVLRKAKELAIEEQMDLLDWDVQGDIVKKRMILKLCLRSKTGAIHYKYHNFDLTHSKENEYTYVKPVKY